MTPPFYRPINQCRAFLVRDHAIGDGHLACVDASAFGIPSASNPVKVVCANVIYAIIGIDGDILEIGGVLEGTSDTGIAAGAAVEVRFTALDLSSLQDAFRSLSFTFNQPTPSSSWTITHNLGKNPSVTVTDSAGSVVIGDVIYLTVNSLRLDFSGGFSGSAYLN